MGGASGLGGHSVTTIAQYIPGGQGSEQYTVTAYTGETPAADSRPAPAATPMQTLRSAAHAFRRDVGWAWAVR